MQNYDQILAHYNNTIGAILTQPAGAQQINPEFIWQVNTKFSFQRLQSNVAIYADIDVMYSFIDPDFIPLLKRALNDYFKPFMKGKESIRHWFKCQNKRTSIFNIAVDSYFGTGNYDAPLVSLQNKDLEMAISIFFEKN